MPVTLSLVDADLRQMVRADLRHFEQRRDESVGRSAVAHAFADRVDPRIERLQRVVDDDAAIAVEAGVLCEPDVGPDAHRHDDKVGSERFAARELHSGDAPRLAGDQRLGFRLEPERETLGLERGLQQLRRRAVELPLHQPRHQMDDGHVHSAKLEAVRGFEAQQPATDDDGMLVLLRRGDHRVGVGDVAIRDDTRQIFSRNRQDHRARSGREQEAIVQRDSAVGGDDFAARAVDLYHFLAEMQGDVVGRVPVAVVQHDLRQRLLAGEHRREEDPVVVRMRLGAKDGNFVGVWSELQQFFQRAHARHAVADHHQADFRAAAHDHAAFSTCACRR
jgi:hypothetical protein